MAKQPFVEVLIRLLRVCVLHVPYAATGHVPVQYYVTSRHATRSRLNLLLHHSSVTSRYDTASRLSELLGHARAHLFAAFLLGAQQIGRVLSDERSDRVEPHLQNQKTKLVRHRSTVRTTSGR
eukprot:1612541-Rhodomonas_salina.1